MWKYRRIFFQDNTPELSNVIELLKKQTGLNIEVINDMEVVNPEMDEDGFLYLRDENYIEIASGNIEEHYLEQAVAYTLLSLGGRVLFPESVPEWTNKKWDEVKELFKK